MEAYRDQYATLFHNGKGVAVIGISTDADTVLANWAREKNFPVYFASDDKVEVGKLYDATIPLVNYERRKLFVIGPDGRVAHIMDPFREISPAAYTELAEAVNKALPPGAK